MILDFLVLRFFGSAEYSAETLKEFAEYSDWAESHFGHFGRGSVSAESHFADSVKIRIWSNLIWAGSVHNCKISGPFHLLLRWF